MTVLYVLSVKDAAAQAFGRPLFMPSLGVAVRAFSDEVNRAAPDNQMNTHPADFELHHIAMFDEASGVFAPPADGSRCIARAVEHHKG